MRRGSRMRHQELEAAAGGWGAGGKDPSLEPLEGARPFDAWTGTSDLRGDRRHPCSEEPFP